MDSRKGKALYTKGVSEAQQSNYEDAFECYAEAFLSRKGEECTLQFVLFYRYQLIKYLRAKGSFFISLPEGDMITDLIYDAYSDYLAAIEASPFCITDEGKTNLLESIVIFPCQIDTDEDEDVL